MALTLRYIKTASFFFLFLTVTCAMAQGTWERISVPTNQFLKSVCFTDSLYGWVAGDSGIILHTTDGGGHWVLQDTHATNEVQDVFFLNRNLGWASTFNYSSAPFGTILLNTTNGGASWQAHPYPAENIFITCILFRDSLNGWMGGMPHALVRTTNGGINWAQAAIDTSTLAFFPVLSIQFYNEQYGYASGGMFDIAGVLWHTSNGGDMWYAIDPAQAPADEVHGLHLFDSLHVMGAGGDPDFGYGVGMTRTSDGGLNWSYDELTIQGNAYDLDFRNGNEVWAPLGTRRKLIYSIDSGVTWSEIPSPDATAIYDMTFPDSLHGFAVGKEGAMLKYIPPVIPSVHPVTAMPPGFSLYQNMPNPAASGTIIRYAVPDGNDGNGFGSRRSAAQLQLRICNAFGNEVACLATDNTTSGDHEIVVDVSGWQGGIYFYMLQMDSPGQNRVVTLPKRMVVLGGKPHE